MDNNNQKCLNTKKLDVKTESKLSQNVQLLFHCFFFAIKILRKIQNDKISIW